MAVVDDGGNLLYLLRIDNTFPAGSYVAMDKARTAATFRMPTRNLEDAVKNGRTSLVAVSEMTPLAGGVPIIVDGHIVGAVGVSGAANAQQDEELANSRRRGHQVRGITMRTDHQQSSSRSIARCGLWLARPAASSNVTFIPAAQVTAAFAKGAVLVNNGTYQVHASRREDAGQVEVHVKDTDVIYMLEGTTTFVTGGTMVGGKTSAPDEIRGSSVNGGETRTLTKGDVIIVPKGTPHWFKDVSGPVLYYVVKVQ